MNIWMIILSSSIALLGIGAGLYLSRGRGLSPVSRAVKSVQIVSDLDALVANTVGFRWSGRLWYIKPLSVEDFFRVTNELAKLDSLRNSKKVGEKDLIQAYADLYEIVIYPRITAEEIKTHMGHSQMAALFNLVMECVMGKAQVEAEKKSPVNVESIHPKVS